MYKYADPHITCSPILAQCSQLFSKNKCMCSFGLRSVCHTVTLVHSCQWQYFAVTSRTVFRFCEAWCPVNAGALFENFLQWVGKPFYDIQTQNSKFSNLMIFLTHLFTKLNIMIKRIHLYTWGSLQWIKSYFLILRLLNS